MRTGYLKLKSALFDRVTGLCSYQVHLDQLLSEGDTRALGVIVLDFPTLAILESAVGWEVSDRFLSGVASLLSALRGRGLPESTVIALDGVYSNSFLIFLREGLGRAEVSMTDLADSTRGLSRHLRGRLATAEWACLQPPHLDFSLGFALVTSHPAARFERLLHQGIRDARDMTLRQADRLQIQRAAELRGILQEARLTTHYQPIVDMEQGSIMGYEALTRGPENTSFEVPEALFSCSERIHLSHELDELCRRQAVRNAHGFDKSKKLFLNSLPETLGSPGVVDGGLRGVLEEAALRPRNLVLEITERTSIEDFEVFGRELDRLRRLGFLVAIDDVGTGYSSLQTISEVQPDFLKVDISLVKNIHQSLIKQELVHS
ncbi:MAG TPA: EAL domain-containing protein, partial [Candidatus Polarisedimenticolia bacterium]|nr:EAL domain-containing protein [Candidatus Polarisedimenticolia bacterium]